MVVLRAEDVAQTTTDISQIYSRTGDGSTIKSPPPSYYAPSSQGSAPLSNYPPPIASSSSAGLQHQYAPSPSNSTSNGVQVLSPGGSNLGGGGSSVTLGGIDVSTLPPGTVILVPPQTNSQTMTAAVSTHAQLLARCAQGLHGTRKTRYGVAGIVAAVLFFPIGFLCMFADTHEECLVCGATL